jgi:hypothetical protein
MAQENEILSEFDLLVRLLKPFSQEVILRWRELVGDVGVRIDQTTANVSPQRLEEASAVHPQGV